MILSRRAGKSATATSAIDSLGQSSGNDRLVVAKNAHIQDTDFFNGRSGQDTILISGNAGISINLSAMKTDATSGFHSYERLAFDNSSGVSSVTFDAAQFGAGLISRSLSVSGAGGTQGITVAGATDFSAAGWTFTSWSAASDTLTLSGADGADTIEAAPVATIIEGRLGNDTMLGGLGADTLVGGLGVDTASYARSGSAVKVNLQSGDARGGLAAGDTLSSVENLTGSRFADRLTGDTGGNVLSGGGGADILIGGAGRDTLNGGQGRDMVSYMDSGDGVIVDLAGNRNLRGDAAGDVLSQIEDVTGSGFDDFLTGNGLNNLLLGGAGDDRLDGGRGGDTLNGGTGIDTLLYILSGVGVAVDLSTGKGTGGLADGDRIAGIENVTGSDFSDTLSGDGRSNALTGGDGNDVLRGGKGADILIGGNGNDTISFAASAAGVSIDLATNTASGGDASGDQISGFENIIGSASGDQLTGSFGNNVIDGGAGDDVLTGGRGKDTLTGGEGYDVICGGGDSDTLSGGNGSDTVSMAGSIWVLIDLSKNIAQLGNGEQPDTISGFENIIGSDYYDTLIGDSGDNLIDGGNGNDKIQSGAGNDTIIGRWGKEKIDSGDGDDILIGNQEDDEMTGGQGNDTFKFVSLSDSGISQGEIDIIWDFKSGSDKLDFSEIDADSSTNGDQAFKFIDGANFSAEGQIRAYQYGSYTIVEINVSGSGGKDMMIALAHGVDLKAGDLIL